MFFISKVLRLITKKAGRCLCMSFYAFSFNTLAQFESGNFTRGPFSNVQQSPTEGTQAIYSYSEPALTSYRISFNAEAHASATLPSDSNDFNISGAAQAPFIQDPNSEFVVNLQGPGAVVVRGWATGQVLAMGGSILGQFTRAYVNGGGSVMWNFPGNSSSGNWGIYVDTSNPGTPTTRSATTVINVPTGLRTLRFFDSARATVQAYRRGAIAKADVSSGWMATFIPSNAPNMTCEQVLQDSVYVFAQGEVMTATFVPNGVNIQKAAAICGCDHFNWYQGITTHPYAAQPYSSHPGFSSIVPFNDPPHHLADGDTVNRIGTPTGKEDADTAPFYFNEPPDSNGGSLNVKQWTTDYMLSFLDVPRDPRLRPGEFIEFNSTLVCVKADGSSKDLYTFKWKSNYTGEAAGL